jgi:hypothetical protein
VIRGCLAFQGLEAPGNKNAPSGRGPPVLSHHPPGRIDGMLTLRHAQVKYDSRVPVLVPHSGHIPDVFPVRS